MQFVVEGLLSPEELIKIQTNLQGATEEWEPGHLTAGTYARQSKNNWQLNRDTALFTSLEQPILEAMQTHPLVRAAAIPLHCHSLLFSRSERGEGYGRHVDNAFMAGGRTDLSYTVFLSAPESYEGGELVIEHPDREDSIKLAAGDAIVYPSSFLHRVQPVQSGTRFVAAGWIQSAVRNPLQRELLFELETACKSLAARIGRCNELDLLYRCHTNLLREWCS